MRTWSVQQDRVCVRRGMDQLEVRLPSQVAAVGVLLRLLPRTLGWRTAVSPSCWVWRRSAAFLRLLFHRASCHVHHRRRRCLRHHFQDSRHPHECHSRHLVCFFPSFECFLCDTFVVTGGLWTLSSLESTISWTALECYP